MAPATLSAPAVALVPAVASAPGVASAPAVASAPLPARRSPSPRQQNVGMDSWTSTSDSEVRKYCPKTMKK